MQLQVLLIDDHLADLDLMTAAFESCPNVDLTTHDHAPTALQWLEAQELLNRLPHLVLLDLHMPGMDGLTWLHALQHHPELHQLPIPLYSLTPPELHAQNVTYPHLCGCWQKPMTFSEMQVQATHLCEIWERDHLFTPAALRVPPVSTPVV